MLCFVSFDFFVGGGGRGRTRPPDQAVPQCLLTSADRTEKRCPEVRDWAILEPLLSNVPATLRFRLVWCIWWAYLYKILVMGVAAGPKCDPSEYRPAPILDAKPISDGPLSVRRIALRS